MTSPIPGKDPALASRFASFDAAMRMADRIAEDDVEWTYNVERQGNTALSSRSMTTATTPTLSSSAIFKRCAA